MTTRVGTVLIVDDQKLNRIILSEQVTQAGYRVETAEGGQQALAMLHAKSFDVVLLDLVMPDMDGYQVLAHIKEDNMLHHIPVIIVSNMSDSDSIVECIERGATDHLPKPVDFLLLRARLETSLAAKWLHDAEEAYTHSLESYTKELEERNEELDAFVWTVAHDLKNPLTAIIGFSELLQRFDDNRLIIKQRHYVNRIVNVARMMETIIQELLLLSHLRKGEVQTQLLNMEDILTAVQDRMEVMVQEYQPKVVLPNSWPAALGYGPWIEEVWVNYFSNALKYGGHPPHLEFGATPQKNGLVRFWLRDNGPGIAPTDQVRLFVPFTRLKQVKIEGQGLGLSIVQRIIEKLDGQIGVESEVGRGSIFWFALPH